MKDLNKYIKESILDDEDDLVVNIKKSTNDLFIRMIAAVESKMSSYDFYKSLEKDNCIEWIYENFPSLKQFKLHLDVNNKYGNDYEKHGFDRTHNFITVGVSIYYKNSHGWSCYDVMTFTYNKSNNTLNIYGKSPVQITSIAYWDFQKTPQYKFWGDLDKFAKKYDLGKITYPATSPYLKARNGNWIYTKTFK